MKIKKIEKNFKNIYFQSLTPDLRPKYRGGRYLWGYFRDPFKGIKEIPCLNLLFCTRFNERKQSDTRHKHEERKRFRSAANEQNERFACLQIVLPEIEF